MIIKNLKLKASADDIYLSVLVTEPEGKAKGILQIVHGMCEHKERYLPFMKYLSEHGIVGIIHDNRGHGESVKSPEDLGYLYKSGWRGLVNDIKVVTEWARSHYHGLEYSLLGHSMGSMAVRSFAKRYDNLIDRLLVIGSPSDNPAKTIGKALSDAICLIRGQHYRPLIMQQATFGAYNYKFRNEKFSDAWLCSDQKVLESYHKDPLCQFRFTANGFSNLLALMADCYSAENWKVSNPDMPVFFISGENDPCRESDKDARKSVDLMKKSGYRNVKAITYPGMRHEILNETGKLKVWNDVTLLIS